MVHVLPHFLKLFLKTLCRSFLFLGAQDTLEVDCHPVACNKVFGLVRNLSAPQASLEPVLEVSLKLLEALPQSELRLNIQHDAHVFAMKLIGDLNTRHNNDFCEVVYRRFSKCFNCDEAESSDDIKENMIIIDILQDGEEDITSVQKGLDVRYADDYRNRMECKCGRNDKGYQYVVMNTPPELAVVIKRYTHDNSVARKLRVPVFPSYLIDLENHSVNNEQKAGSSQQRGDSLETQYILRSVVTHHGSSLDAGHYTCCVFLNEHTVLTMNDNAVTVSESEWNEELLYNSYMLFYERVDTVDMMFDSCAPALMFCLFADRTKLSTRWKRSFPLRKFNQVRDEFLDQKITKTLFHQLLLIAAREVYQRLPCDVYDKDFDVLTCLLMQQCVRNISLRLIGVEIVDCRECGSCNVDLVISVDKLMSLEKRINSNNFKGVKNNAKSLGEKAFSQAITAYCIDEIHWIAMVFDFTSGLITYIDPLGNSPCLRAVKLLTNYVNVYTAIVHRGEGISESKLYVMSSDPNFTRQRDSVSCGVYICMYLRFKVLSRNLLPTNINIHLERRHIYLAITGKSICVTSNMVEKIMVAHLHAIPRDAGRSYKFQDTGKQSVITLTERELNDLNSDDYQELYDRAVRKYPDLTSGYVYELVKKARNTIETEMSNILKACNDSNSQTLKPFVEVLDLLKARDYRRLKKYETSRNDSHSKYFAGKESLMESVLDIKLRTILFKSFENEGRNGHMKISVIGECCSSSDPICRSSVHFMEHVLIPICMIGYAAESKKLSRDEAIAKMYSVQV